MKDKLDYLERNARAFQALKSACGRVIDSRLSERVIIELSNKNRELEEQNEHLKSENQRLESENNDLVDALTELHSTEGQTYTRRVQ